MISDIAAYVAFAAVVEEGSLAAAARRLGSSKTAVSRYVARLEALAGVKLVNRTSRKLGLTASGARNSMKAAETSSARCPSWIR